MISKCEQMIFDLINELMRIAFHPGIQSEEAILQEITEEHSLEKQRERVESVAKRKTLAGAQGAYWDPHTLLHSSHINSGTIGTWKTELSKE